MSRKRRDLDWMAEQIEQFGFKADDVCVLRAYEEKGARGFFLGHLRSRHLVQVHFSASGRAVHVLLDGTPLILCGQDADTHGK